jgi:uncharacterized membrane protein (UPF0182 family)
MFGWFKKDPTAKLQKEIAKKYEQSVQLQRNGDLEAYGRIMKEIEELEQKLEAISAQ